MNQIAILDAGSQYCKLIDKQLKNLKINPKIIPLNTPLTKLKEYKGIIISGGPKSVILNRINFDISIFFSKIPILGICYGMQLITKYFDGQLSNTIHRTDGQKVINLDRTSLLFQNMNRQEKVLLTHGDSVIKEPIHFQVIAHEDNIIYGIEYRHIYGIQFHPEVNLTENGSIILHNFVYNICKCLPENLSNMYDILLNNIHNTAKDNKVITLVSGGVDSTVCTILLSRALGNNKVFPLHIDNGFMRKDESSNVKKIMEEIGIKLRVVDASDIFYENIGDKTDPEEIRNIIGDTFMNIVDKIFQQLSPDHILGQGTLRPDLIESASNTVSQNASVIKTHHNDSMMVRKWRQEGRIIEPLSEYHKDEVKQIGRWLNIPESFLERQPFPGPGLAIRIICDEYRINYDIIDKELDQFRLKYDKYNFNLLPIRSVGVQGDHRSYNYVASISYKYQEEKIGWELLIEIAKEIPKYIKHINRVIFIFGKAFKEIKYIKTRLIKEVVNDLRDIDNITHKYIEKITQMPIIMIPISFDNDGKRSVVIRTIITNDFMTGVVANPDKEFPKLSEMVKEMMGYKVSRICYDLTSKPPGTTEWL